MFVVKMMMERMIIKDINLFILIIFSQSEAVSCHASESNGCLHGITE